MIKVKDNNSLVRDPHSRAIINVDRDEYTTAKMAAQRANRLNCLDEDVQSLKGDMQEIKQILLSLTKRS